MNAEDQDQRPSRAPFYAEVRRAFGDLTQSQVDGFEALLAAFAREPGLPITHAAYILATPWHETGRRMQPVRETFADSDAQAIARLDRAWVRGQLPWVGRPYWRRDARGRAWFGRGLAQITHEDNYRRADRLIGGVGLADDPSLALVPEHAIQILIRGMQSGIFTGKALGDSADYVSMRWIINGDTNKPVRKGARQTMGQMIAGYARTFERALRATYPDGVIR